MQYLERTLQVRSALLERSDLLDRMREILVHMIENDRRPEDLSGAWVGSGSSRDAFEVGTCPIEDVGELNILLKIYNNKHNDHRTWDGACGLPYKKLGHGSAEEFGAFEAYYDFAAGHIPAISFSSKRKLNRYNKELSGYKYRLRQDSMHIVLSEWDGTRVGVGDFGALPYFQMAVKWGKYFGWLTEGEPPVIPPKGTAREYGSDENNVERRRIIDLSAHHCTLREINRERPIMKGHQDYLGLLKRGEKYLLSEYRLEV